MLAEREIEIGLDDTDGGMTDAEIDAKHIRLRGSLALKYPPREACCWNECGLDDYFQRNGKPPKQHRCFLTNRHQGPCEFSSECATYEKGRSKS